MLGRLTPMLLSPCRNLLGHNGATTITNALKVNTNITKIDLECCFLDHIEPEVIAYASEINTTITVILS